MFSKPISFILVYLLSVFNFLIITLPFLAVFSPLLFIGAENFMAVTRDFMIFCIFIISLLMMFYLVFDLLLGISVMGMTRGHKKPRDLLKKFSIMKKIEDDYNDLQKKFRIPNTTLLISRDPVVNAYAIGSFRKNVVVLTMGLLVEYKRGAQNSNEFYQSIKGIVAHELSHLANRDFLPGLLVFANEKAVRFTSSIIRLFFLLFARIFTIIPVLGSSIYNFVMLLYKLVDKILNAFFAYVFMPLYNFIKLHVSRATEYRCDRQAAEACGGKEMATALSGLGESGFVTIFSTHPATRSRVRYVKNRKMKKGRIRVSILNKLSNIFAVTFLLFTLYFAHNHIKDIQYFHAKFYIDFLNDRNDSFYETMESVKQKLKL